MKINTNIIKYGDVCYVPENDHTKHYGYTSVLSVNEEFIHLKVDDEEILSVTARHLCEMEVDFVKKEEWIRKKKAYYTN